MKVDFAKLINNLDFFVENDEKIEKIRSLFDSNGLIFFFTKDGKLYGTPEESRLVFAKMKSRDKDIAPSSNFIGFDLEKAMLGQEILRIFSKKDLKLIKVISRETAENLLTKVKSNDKSVKLSVYGDEE